MGLLDHKVAIITGASQGLGLEIARHYVAEGARVAICARDGRTLEAAAEGISGNSSGMLRIEADVSRPDEAAMIVSRTMNAFGRLDVLVNNAGVTGPKGSLEQT